MRKLVRLLVMWLVALALPIQGVAAATMRHCGSESAHAGAVVVDQSIHADSDSPPMVAGTAEYKHHGVHVHVDAAEPAHDHASHDKGSCSACASCCSAAALLTTPVMPMAATVVRSAAIALPTTLLAAFLTDGPDRPPRSIFG
jgi:hypothetical protein